MKEKFLQFFTGKLSKSIYIAVASAVVCGVAVVTTVVVVHNNNQKLDTALERLNEQTATLTQTESATEDVSGASDTEPSGDRALQYLAEYDRITEEYEAKRAELVAQTAVAPVTVTVRLVESSGYPLEPHSRAQLWNETSEEYAAYLKEYEKELQEYEELSRTEEESRRIAEEEARKKQEEAKRKAAEEQARVENVQKQIDALDAQYEKDIAELKAQYGIS